MTQRSKDWLILTLILAVIWGLAFYGLWKVVT